MMKSKQLVLENSEKKNVLTSRILTGSAYQPKHQKARQKMTFRTVWAYFFGGIGKHSKHSRSRF